VIKATKAALLETAEALARAREARVAEVAAWRQEARQLAGAGDSHGARTLLERVAEHSPGDAQSWHELAAHHVATGDVRAAAEAILRALRLEPFSARHHLLFGKIPPDPATRQQYAELIKTAAADIASGDGCGCEPWLRTGNLKIADGDLAGAQSAFEEALRADRNSPGAWANLADVLQEMGDARGAARARAFHAHAIGDFHAAAAAFRPLWPHAGADAELYWGLADSLRELGESAEGAAVCRVGIAACGPSERLEILLSECLYRTGAAAESRAAAAQAAMVHDGSLALRLRAELRLPIVYRSEEELAEYRQRFSESLDRIAAELRLDTAEQRRASAGAVANWTNFYLAYQSGNDLELQRRYGQLARRIMTACYPQWAEARPSPHPGRLRIGYASKVFRANAVSSLSLGWLRGHDRQSFEVFAYNLGSFEDNVSARFRAASEHYRFLPRADVAAAASNIAADRLDLLVYPDVGMTAFSSGLAALRLAPVQCASWCHPVTTGLPSVDYFLSGDLMEPAGAEAHYSERLVRLPNMGVAYEWPGIPAQTSSRAEFGLADDAVVYLCCQSLFKYLPRHDHVWPAIAQQAPNARFVFLEHPEPDITQIFRRRMEEAFARDGVEAERHCRFLPMQAYLPYLRLMAVSDVFLDSLGWSGGNTSYEAAALELPMVTLPGEFMRGRHCYGIQRMMGVTELVARDEQHYVALAARLGRDKAWREEMRAKVRARREVLFEDPRAVPALEQFYRDAAGSPADGE